MHSTWCSLTQSKSQKGVDHYLLLLWAEVPPFLCHLYKGGILEAFLEMTSNIRNFANPIPFRMKSESITQDKMANTILLLGSRAHLPWNAKESQPLCMQNSHNTTAKKGYSTLVYLLFMRQRVTDLTASRLTEIFPAFVYLKKTRLAN